MTTHCVKVWTWVALACLVAGCRAVPRVDGADTAAADAAAADAQDAAIAAEATLPPEGVVDLTVWFRRGSGSQAVLVPVVRSAPVDADLPRTALELLLAGPTADDGTDLVAPLPTTTRVLGFQVDGATAQVDLSAAVLDDAASVDPTPEHEVLALAALADTLTEFPQIDQVAVTVEGARDEVAAGFWGGWGLPVLLVRDESVIDPVAAGGGAPVLERFTASAQTAGDPAAAPVQVTSVRVRQRTATLTVVVELADGADGQASAPVPAVRAYPDGDDVVLQIGQVVSYAADVGVGQALALAGGSDQSVTVEPADLPGAVRLRVAAGAVLPFHLQTLTSPTRVVLDVARQ